MTLAVDQAIAYYRRNDNPEGGGLKVREANFGRVLPKSRLTILSDFTIGPKANRVSLGDA